jgi:hypothetical protein
MGYFRDDTALQELILEEKGQRDLNRLWDEFDYSADYTARTWVQFYDNASGAVRGTGAESGTLRPEDAPVTSMKVIFALRDEYLAKARADASNDPVAAEAILDHFHKVNNTLRRNEKMRADSEPLHLNALLKFAGRAYRRPLAKAEADDLLAYYKSLRGETGLSHEEAMRDSIVSVLMPPNPKNRPPPRPPGPTGSETSSSPPPAPAWPWGRSPRSSCSARTSPPPEP